MAKSEIYEQLKKSFENDEWSINGEYTVEHRRSKLEIWISHSTRSYFTGYHNGLYIPKKYRKKLKRILNESLVRQDLAKLK